MEEIDTLNKSIVEKKELVSKTKDNLFQLYKKFYDEYIDIVNQLKERTVELEKETTSIYKFDYINGVIENTFSKNVEQTDLLKSIGIREHITDIVEGGKEAFKNREKKYGFYN